MCHDVRLTNQIVGFNVASAMVMQALSVDALALALRTTPDDLRACFRGDARLPVDTLCIAAQRLRVPIQYLFFEDDSVAGYVLH
jgi:hypothetical protein